MAVVKSDVSPSERARACLEQGGDYEDEGSGDRVVGHHYRDPLEAIWLYAARRLGIVIVRSDEVFASWNGDGTLTLSVPAGFDADDCMAQMVLHELAHALVQGAGAWQESDWGLHNTDGRDLAAEHAAQRVQAALAQPFGLRSFVAVTTRWRDYYDGLPADPLAGPDADPAVRLARLAFARSRRPPWRDAIDDALAATAAIARVVRPIAGQDSLWSTTKPC